MKPLRSIIAAFAFALCGTSAWALPVLRADVQVVGSVVTVGDMFDDAGSLADTALFRAPQPGTTGQVDLPAIRSAAARIGLDTFEVNGLSAVSVSRAATVIDDVLLGDLVINDLRLRGIVTSSMKVNVYFNDLISPIKVAVADTPARLEQLRYHPGNDSFTARFSVTGADRLVELSGTLDLTVDVPHLAAALPAGTVLQPSHIVMRPLPVRQADAQGVAQLDQLVGMALNRPSREGMLLKASDVSTPLTIAKNDLVTIFYRKGPMTLTVKGQAITGGAQGTNVQILNLMSKRVISATAIAPGAVEVSTAPLALAGL